MAGDDASRIEISTEDLQHYQWQEIIANAKGDDCALYVGPLAAEAERLKKEGDHRGYETLAFLAQLASLTPDYSQKGNPYEPPWRGPVRLSPSGLDALGKMLPDIRDPEFRAKVGDLLWEFRRRSSAAEIAVKSLMKSARAFENPKEWPRFTQRLERAVSLAAKLGKQNALHQEICKEIEAAINKHKGNTDTGYLCAKLVEILTRQKRLDGSEYGSLCVDVAKLFESAKDWDRAHRYWKLSARFKQRIPDVDGTKAALLCAAECWVNKAEANLAGDKPDNLFASHWMGMAFRELQQAGATDERKNDVQRKWRELQKLGMGEIKPLDLSESLLAQIDALGEKLDSMGREHVRGYSFQRAVFRLAFIVPPPHPDAIKKRVENESQQSIWMNLMPVATVTETGLTADQLGSMPQSEGPEREEWMLKRAYLHARQLEWPQLAQLVDAARRQIVEEHPSLMADLEFLVISNNFIRPGHEGIYLRGLHAGMVGDWLVTVHLLIPQLEASVRWVFEQRGIITSTAESEGTEQEHLLGKLLYHPQMDEIFGVDRGFNLRGILVEKFGFNLRNDMAHGFISEQAFSSPAAATLWWLVLQMCCLGVHS